MSHLLYRPNLNVFLPSLYSGLFFSYTFFSYVHEFMEKLRKLELQVSNWLTYFIHIYYLYSYKNGTKILQEISSATPKVQGRNCVRFPERFKVIIMVTWK